MCVYVYVWGVWGDGSSILQAHVILKNLSLKDRRKNHFKVFIEMLNKLILPNSSCRLLKSVWLIPTGIISHKS